MISSARWLATLGTSGAAMMVLVLFAPALQQPFLVPKFAALELTAWLGVVALALRWASAGGTLPRWNDEVAIGVCLVLATTALAWIVAAGRPWGAVYAVPAVARWGSLFGLGCGVIVLDDAPDARQRMLESVTVAGAAVAAIGLLQHLELMPLPIPVISIPGSTFGNRNLAAEVMAMALPLGVGAAAGARRGSARVAVFVALALELLFLAVTRTRGAWFGATCGLVTVMGLARPRVSRRLLGVSVSVVVLAVVAASFPGRFNPHDAADAKRYSGVVEVLQEGFDVRSGALRTRLGLWRRTLAMVRDYPLAGVGPGNWPVVFPLYAEPGASRDGVLSATLAPRQAHDDLLERAAETGGLGLVAVAWLAVAAVRSARQRLHGDGAARAVTAAGAGALVGLLALSLTSFPLESPGTLALAGLALGLVAANSPTGAPSLASCRSGAGGNSPAENGESLASLRSGSGGNSPAENGESLASLRSRVAGPSAIVRYVLLTVALAFGPWIALRAERSIRSSRWLGVAERAMRHDQGALGAAQALSALRQAVKATPNEYRIHLRTAQMLLRQGRAAESASAARNALAIEPYAPNAWAALAAAHLSEGDRSAARADAGQALRLLRDYPFALYIRASAAEQRGDTAAAQSDREQLDLLAADGPDEDTARAARALRDATDAGN